MKALISVVTPLLLLACGSGAPSSTSSESRAIVKDEHSLSNPAEVRVEHIKLDLEILFAEQRLKGRAILKLSRGAGSHTLVLDTQALEILGVEGADGRPREWSLEPAVDRLGRALRITLRDGDDEVGVRYRTGEGAEALQFLSPAMAGGEHPYLFTQGESILTRSWIPCQDTPGVRVTYDANIIAPRPLTVLMSADRRGGSRELVQDDGIDEERLVWSFEMTRPIPCYLIALACGEIEERPISERCSVYAAPSLVDAAAEEFADLEEMVSTAEGILGPYRWGRYDLLVLPPAFPYGGMENPTLTFLTPTVIAGDRSLVSVVAHELAHSWSGNLVTNATWSDFWLNEGFTVYCERRIMEALYGLERVRMDEVLAGEGLEREMQEMQAWQTVLHTNLTGKHPDEGFSGVPYNKGALFLHRLEALLGRREFDLLLREWFDGHAFQSVTTSDLESFLAERLPPGAIDLTDWFEGVGLPQDAPHFESPALEQVDEELERLAEGAAPKELETAGWVTAQWLAFIRHLPADTDAETLALLDQAFGFTQSGNAEILAAWLERGIASGYAGIDARLESFLIEVGRFKYLGPLYRALVQRPGGRERAREIFERARPGYHPVSAGRVEAILNENG